ncbi:MAG TPA: hypothetical protein PLV68_09795, partial [Ilumatobacteraceae bacterium]|nr:hypothetical protein [Ilumatobacteraceae bacterium]
MADGLASDPDHPLPLPSGLLAGLGNQLDLRRQLSPPAYLAFENTAWVPTQAMLSANAAEQSNKAGLEALASTQIAGSIPVLTGMPGRGPGTGAIEAGVLHLAKPFDADWTLTVDGTTIDPRPAFGTSMAFDVPVAGTARLAYDTGFGRHLAIQVQALAWLALLLAASRISW